MSKAETPRYCAPGDGAEGGYIIGCDPATPAAKPVVFRRLPDGRIKQMVDDYVAGVDCGPQPKGDALVAMAVALSAQKAAETTNEKDNE